MATGKKRGRKRIPLAARAEYRNVTLDAEVQEMLVEAQEKLKAQFGFKPTHSQVIRYLLKQMAESRREPKAPEEDATT